MPTPQTLLERGAKPAQIQKLLAHADISTTMLYTEVSSEELADVARLLEGPETYRQGIRTTRGGAR